MKNNKGTKDSNPPKDIAAKPSTVVALSEYKYFVPIFLRAQHRLEARAKPIPTIEDRASDMGSDPTAVVKIIIMMKMILQLKLILPMMAMMIVVQNGSDILTR